MHDTPTALAGAGNLHTPRQWHSNGKGIRDHSTEKPQNAQNNVGSGFPPSLRFASARRAVAQSAEAAAGLEEIRLKADATSSLGVLRVLR
jgi:hypothetical protein